MRSEREVQNLIARLATGENKAWKIFFEEFHPVFEGYLNRRASNLDIDNILSNFYLKLTEEGYRRILQFTYGNQKNFINYLLTILQNEVESESKNRIYKTSQFEPVHDIENSQKNYSEIIPGEEEILPGITEEIFLSAIMELELKPREAIYYQFRGFTNQDIAELMGVSINTVLSWNSRSKKRLKILLENYRGVQ